MAADALPVGHQRVHVDRLRPHPLNEQSRAITEERFLLLVRNVAEDPQTLEARPVICTPAGEVVAGRHRLDAARHILDGEPLPFRVTRDLFDAHHPDGLVPAYVRHYGNLGEVREAIAKDNAEFAHWVPEELARMVAQHEREGYDAALMGLDEEEVRELVERADGDVPLLPDDGGGSEAARREIDVHVECPGCGHRFRP